MMAERITLPGGRLATLVPADEAGKFYLSAAEGVAAHLKPHLSWRQHTALCYMAKLYGKSGGKRIWAQPGHGDGPDNEADAAEYRDLEAAAGQVMGFQIRTLCQGDWPTAPWLTLARLGQALDRVADRLRLTKG